jgi:hypothetical protein
MWYAQMVFYHVHVLLRLSNDVEENQALEILMK